MTMSKRSISPLLLIPMLLTSALALTACGGSMPSASAGIDLPRLSATWRKSHDPVVVPEQALTQDETERYWRGHRVSLVKCEASRSGLVTYNDVLALKLGAANLRK